MTAHLPASFRTFSSPKPPREDQSPPEFAQVARNVVTELPNGVGQQRASAGITVGESQQAGPGHKGNPATAHPVKPRDNPIAGGL